MDFRKENFSFEKDQSTQRELLEKISIAKTNSDISLSLNLKGVNALPKELGDLPKLTHLCIYFGHQLSNIKLLSHLTALTELKIHSCCQLDNLSSLSHLTALTKLEIHHSYLLDDLSPLSSLPALTKLSITNCPRLIDLTPLSFLTTITSLLIFDCSQLRDITPLSPLKKLTDLSIVQCRQLRDITSLSHLSALKRLNLDFNQQLTNLTPLTNLTALINLRLKGSVQLNDLTPLSPLTSLTFLDLGECRNLSNLTALSTLTSLTILNLSECPQLTDLTPLSYLNSLKYLLLMDSVPIECKHGSLQLEKLTSINNLRANRLISAPSELASKNWRDNALPRIRQWQQDIAQHGEAEESIIKLFVLGNGHVGKTQLCRRLQGLDFDSSIPSTHGIDLGETCLRKAQGNDPAVIAKLWDFGGQDIYLGTHAMFLDDRAIFVIAWSPDYENTDEVEENGITMRNRPLLYWLEYVRSHVGIDAPVIVVQTQCDYESNASKAPIPKTHNFSYLKEVDSSAKIDDGIESLQLALKKSARYQLERFGKVCIPQNWVDLSNELENLRNEKLISHQSFTDLCQKNNSVAVPSVVLEYLHRSGQIFWKKEVFNDSVVLDLSWMLEGVYTLFNRDSALPIITNQKGFFTPTLLSAIAWKGYSENEQQLFLSIMQECKIIVKLGQEENYLTPHLLPTEDEQKTDIGSIWRNAEADASVQLDYDFLHEGVLREIICEIGKRAGFRALYWFYGVCYYDQYAQAVIRIRSQLPNIESETYKGSIIIEASSNNSPSVSASHKCEKLVHHICEAIRNINIGQRPHSSKILSRIDSSLARTSEHEQTTKMCFDHMQPAIAPLQKGEKTRIYVSYSWATHSVKIVDEIESKLSNDLFEFKRDKHTLKTGDSLTQFMKEIGRGSHIFVVISEEYLRSDNCMRELLNIYNHSINDRSTFDKKVIPLFVDELPNYSRADVRDKIYQHWEKKHDSLDDILAKRSALDIGIEDQKELVRMKDFMMNITNILAWISDTLMPRGMDGVSAAIQLLEDRVSVD